MTIPPTKKEEINKFFVYGTLRPDIKAPWSDIVHKNESYKLCYYKSRLHYAKLYFHKIHKYPVTLHSQETYQYEDFVVGYILESNNVEETLKLLDSIEEYPDVYDREVVDCFNEDTQQVEKAYFYFIKTDKIEEDLIQLKNDWKECYNRYLYAHEETIERAIENYD